MTEQEAAERLAALLNEIEASDVAFDVYDGEIVFGRLSVDMAPIVKNEWRVTES